MSESNAELPQTPESLTPDQVVRALLKVYRAAQKELNISGHRHQQAHEMGDELGRTMATTDSLSATSKLSVIHSVVDELGLQREFMAQERDDKTDTRSTTDRNTLEQNRTNLFSSLFRRR